MTIEASSEWEFTLTLDGVPNELDDSAKHEAIIEAIASSLAPDGLTDFIIGRQDGQDTVDFFRPAPTLADAVRSAIGQVNRACRPWPEVNVAAVAWPDAVTLTMELDEACDMDYGREVATHERN